MRCIGVDGECGRPVALTGGAWCARCRPVDLTGGVAPWDTRPRGCSRGYRPTVRAVWGEVPAMLRAAGWELVDGPSTRTARERWRHVATGRVVSRDTARASLCLRSRGAG